MEDQQKNIAILTQKIVEFDDQNAFRSFFEYYYPRVLSFSSYLVGSKQIAEDVTSEVFLKFWNNRKNVVHFDNIQNYLFVTAKHLVINYLAKNKHIKYIAFDGVNISSITSYNNPESEIIHEELQQKLAKAIDQLPEKCKMIYVLVKEENLKYKEVAELLDISIKTVENQMGIALTKLRNALSEYKVSRSGPFLSINKINFFFNLIFF